MGGRPMSTKEGAFILLSIRARKSGLRKILEHHGKFQEQNFSTIWITHYGGC